MASSHKTTNTGSTLTDDEWVQVSDHAYDRWAERKPDGTLIGPRVAWVSPHTVTIPRPNGIRGDSARLHRPTDTVLVEEDGFLVTILLAEKADGELRDALNQLTPEEQVEPTAVP